MKDFLKDETGSFSSARLAFWVTLLFTFVLIAAGADRTAEVWGLLREVLLVLGGWAGGPRIMQYISKLRSSASDVVFGRSTIPPG